MLIAAVFIGFACLLVGLFYWAHVREKKRREDLQVAADELQLTYLPEGDAQVQQFFGPAKLLSRGRARKLTNLIKGETDEVEIAIFDYRYTTGSGKNSRTISQSVAGLKSTFLLPVPAFNMRPEGMLDKVGGALGFQDIDFESHPEFSNSFVLQGKDEDAIRSFFVPQIIEYFESHRGISVQTVSGGLLLFRAGTPVKPEEFKDLLADAYEVFGLMIDNKF